MRVIVLLAYNALRLLTWPLWALWWRSRRITPDWVVLSLRGAIDELPRAQPRLLRFLRGMRPPRRSVLELRMLVDRIAASGATGLLVRLEPLEAGYATLASVRAELLRLRAAGKQVVCYLPTDASQRELYLSSAADRVIAMPHAGFSALGPAASRTYLARLLERVGLRALVTAEGRYKSAADMFVRDSMSEAEREQLGAIVRALYGALKAAFASRPAIGDAGAEAVFHAGMFGAGRARELGLVDAHAYDDELTAQLGRPARTTSSARADDADDAAERPVGHERFLQRSAPRSPVFMPLRRSEKIAVVRLVGAISERGGGNARSGIDLHGTTAVLRRLAEHKQVAGVILHVDSPGGSALVSELLHREIVRLDEKKPVVTWMGDVAASGGYYLAAATRSIIAQPTTLTGSIGVISIRPIAARLLELLEVRRELVQVTPFADLHDFSKVPSEAEQALLRGETQRFYDRFLDVVAHGRKRGRDEIVTLAGGRVWSGQDARDVGLVDVLGGYAEARRELERLLGDSARRLDDEPLLVRPAKREVPALPPIGAPRDALQALGALFTDASALQGVVAALDEPSELAFLLETLRELWSLSDRGARCLAYGLGVPALR